MKTYTIKDLNEFVGPPGRINKYGAMTKRLVARAFINPSKYKVVGIIGRGSKVLLEDRYYNNRNRLGRFSKMRNK